MKTRLITAIAALISFGAFNVQASQISGFGSPTLDPSLTGGAVETFDGAGAGVYTSFTGSNGVTLSGNSTFTIDSAYVGSYNTTGVNSAYNGPYGTVMNQLSQWTFNFAAPVSAFAFNFGASDDGWTLRAYDSSSTLIDSYDIPATHASNAGDYYGLADAGIAWATLTDDTGNGGDWVFIDNVTVPSGGSTVPDGGSTLLLLGGAVTALAAFSRRKRA